MSKMNIRSACRQIGLLLIANACTQPTLNAQTPAPLEAPFTQVTSGPVVTSGGFGFGCAWGDYDADGLIDLFVCNWTDGTFTPHDFLYHNLGHGNFERVTNVPMVNANAWATGASWGDYDNDGRLDLFVTRPTKGGFVRTGPNTLYHNEGGGKFTKVTTGLLVTEVLKSHAGIWADFNNDGLLDLFVANFGSNPPTPAVDNYLYYNLGGGNFQRTSFGAKSATNGSSFDVAAADFNNDGWIDLFVAQGAGNNQQNSLPYMNNQNGTFTLLTNNVVYSTLANGAGAAWGDYDNDGLLDVFVSVNPEGHALLYHNNGDGTFSAVTNSAVTLDVGSTAGCAWGDYDNDGWLDLFVARFGKLDDFGNLLTKENNLLFHNNGDGTFTKVAAGSVVTQFGYSFGCAWGDYDNDGFIDLFVSNGFVTSAANDFLYHNNGNTNHWINFRLAGTLSNRAAIGAKVRVKATIGGKSFWQMREISGGSGHGCQNDLRANFGLGDATNIDLVRIEWPSGITQTLTNVSANQFMVVSEHQEIAPGPLAFQSVNVSTNGVVALEASGSLGFLYLLEDSTSLTNWNWLGVRTNQGGIVRWELPGIEPARRFFRLSAP
jgi:hypothetical protein